jgi:hypothetical protein
MRVLAEGTVEGFDRYGVYGGGVFHSTLTLTAVGERYEVTTTLPDGRMITEYGGRDLAEATEVFGLSWSGCPFPKRR